MTKALIRSLNRRGSQADKTPPVARRQKFSDPSICDRCGAVYTGKSKTEKIRMMEFSRLIWNGAQAAGQSLAILSIPSGVVGSATGEATGAGC